MTTVSNYEFIVENIWESIGFISRSSSPKKIASAYLGSAVNFQWNAGDILLIGLSEKNVLDGLVNIDKVKELINTGVKVYKQENLHAKIYFTEEMAVVGSCNLSAASQNEWLEAGIVTTDIKTLKAIQKFFEDYATIDKLVTNEMLEKLKLLKDKNGKNQDRRDVKKIEERVWVITTAPIGKEDQVTEQVIAAIDHKAKANIDGTKATLFSIRLYDPKFFEIKEGDFVIRLTKNNSETVLFPLYKCIQASPINEKLYYINLTQQKGVESKKWKDVMQFFEGFNLPDYDGEVIDNAGYLIRNVLLSFSFL